MITRLRARGFKSWADTDELRIAPLTGLFGANSSGKTSLLQTLLLLKQTVESSDRRQVLNTGDSKSLVDLGTFFDLVHGHQAADGLSLSLSWRLPEPLVVQNPQKRKSPLFNINELSFSTYIHAIADYVRVQKLEYEFDKHSFMMLDQRQFKNGQDWKYELLTQGFDAKRFPGRAWPLPAPVKCYGFPDEVQGYYRNLGFLSEFVLAFEQLFARVSYLGPLRGVPERRYGWSGESPVDVGRSGELAIPALLAARKRKLKLSLGKGRNRGQRLIEERIAEWLREMGLIESFSLQPIGENRKDYELKVRKTANGPEVFITDVGFGVSQILPVLVLCYYVPEGSIVLLEQPEIHLHPAVQSVLADVLIEVVTKRKIQIIFESHSEHLLHRLQRRVAEGAIRNQDLALYFCQLDTKHTAASEIEELEVDEFGNITNWPPQFFGDEMADLVAMVDAEVQRKGKQP
jgi:predicted ATPase